MAPPKKLTMETARRIRSLFQDGATIPQICRDFNISKGLAQDIKAGIAYREDSVSDPYYQEALAKYLSKKEAR